MPIYEYECSACGHRLEAFQSMSEAPLTECPVCNKTALQKLISAAGFQLKGTGWYVTDFRNKGKKPDSGSSNSGSSSSSSSGQTSQSSGSSDSGSSSSSTSTSSTDKK